MLQRKKKASFQRKKFCPKKLKPSLWKEMMSTSMKKQLEGSYQKEITKNNLI